VLMMAGAITGVIFGMAAQHSQFCLRVYWMSATPDRSLRPAACLARSSAV
jgi:hypothetical protein